MDPTELEDHPQSPPGEVGLRERLSRVRADGDCIPESDWAELGAIEREVYTRIAQAPAESPWRAGASLQARLLAWRGQLAQVGGLEAEDEQTRGLLGDLFLRRLERWRDESWRALGPKGSGTDPDRLFARLTECTRVDRLGREMGAFAAGDEPPTAADRSSLRDELAVAVANHPPLLATRASWTDRLVDAANDALTSVDGETPRSAAATLAAVADDLEWHVESIEGEPGRERGRLRRRARRLRAEQAERDLQARLEGMFGRRLTTWWERGVLIAIFIVVGLMLVPVVVDVSPAGQRALLIADAVVCLFFLWDFGFKLALVHGRARWFARHFLTDLLPALPFGILLLDVEPAVGAAAGANAQSVRSVLLLRLIRLPRLARYLRLLMPFVRIARVFGFMLRGSDRLVRQHGRVLDQEVILYPTPAERRRGRELRESSEEELWSVSADIDRMWARTLVASAVEARPEVARARLAILRSSIENGGVRPTIVRAGATSAHERGLCAEDLLERLSAISPEEIESELGRDFVSRVAQAARGIARSPLRWLPIFAAYVPRVADEDSDAEVTARFTRGASARLLGHLRRVLWFSDLHGTVSPSDLVGRVGATLVKRTARPAVRLLLLGGAYLLLMAGAGLLGLELGSFLERLGGLIGTTLYVVGGVCFFLLGLGVWLQRLASDASIYYAQIASAQFLHLTEAVKVRYLPRDAELFGERVFAPERELEDRGDGRNGASSSQPSPAEPQAEADRERFLSGVCRWLTTGVPVECSGSGFDPVARSVLLYRDVLDGALLVETDTRATGQLLGNLALKSIRRASGRIERRLAKSWERLDLERRRTLVGGPYLWFNFISRTITQQVARLIVDYNQNAIPLVELASSSVESRARYEAWLESRSSRPAKDAGAADREAAEHCEQLTTAFTALHFLDDAPERDAAIERRFGAAVAALLARDRRALFRRVFGTYPMHLRPHEERVLNLRDVYRRWVEGGRIVWLPLRVFLLGVRQTARGLGFLGRSVKRIRDPELAYSSDADVESDFATAARKIDRMRGPAAMACLWMRALIDAEYLGVPLPGATSRGFVGSSVEVDLEYLAAPYDVCERVAGERGRATADVRRLRALLEGGLLERLGARISDDFEHGPEHLRAVTVAYRADYGGLRSLLSAREVLAEVYGEAAGVTALPPRVFPRIRLWRAFGRYWREHGSTDRRAQRRAWRATLHDVDGVIESLLVLDRLGVEAARARGEELLAEVLRHPAQVTEQIVTLRAVQTLSLIDMRNYRTHVWRLGRFEESGDTPGRAFRIGGDPEAVPDVPPEVPPEVPEGGTSQRP